MSITLVQKNGALTASSGTCTMPTWGSTTVAGNLLVLIAAAQPPGTPIGGNAGYTVVPQVTITPAFPFNYSLAQADSCTISYKIAAGADATPASFTTPSAGPWSCYSYEFASPFGWRPNAADIHLRTSQTNTAVTTAAVGPGIPRPSFGGLDIFLVAMLSTTPTGLSFTDGFTLEQPATNNARLWVGWKDAGYSQTGQQGTANWTNAVVPGAAIVRFCPVFAPLVYPGAPFQYGGYAT